MDLRGRVVRRWLLSFIILPMRLLPGRFWKRTLLLQRLYSKYLYKGETLTSLGRDNDLEPGPEVHLLSTSLTTGFLCSFTHEGFWSDTGNDVTFIRSGLLPLSLAVAASSAFPPLFPPVILSRKMLDATTAELPYDPELLTDGGIFDNLGIRKFRRLTSKVSGPADLVIVSDAGAGFDWQVGRRFGNIATRTVRATDILMKRVGDFERESIDFQNGNELPQFLKCDISTVIPPHQHPGTLDDNIQKRIGRIRTDLNRFSPIEINALGKHGYSVCAQTIGGYFSRSGTHYGKTSTQNNWMPIPNSKAIAVIDFAKKLESARGQKLGIWNPRDWASWTLMGLMLLIPALIVASFALNVAFVQNARQNKVALFYTTNRVANASNTADPAFSTDFSDELDTGALHLGSVDVSIPAEHRIGQLEEPSIFSLQFKIDPTRHVALLDIKASAESSFVNDLRAAVTASQGNLVIFVNGINTDFRHSLLSDATLKSDLIIGAPVLDFSWPSGGILQYAAAEERVEESVEQFSTFLETTCKEIGVKRVSFIARGMGARIAMGALMKRSLTSSSACNAEIGPVVLIGPDIGSASFSQEVSQLTKSVKQITVYRVGTPDVRAARAFHQTACLGDPAGELSLPPQVEIINVQSGNVNNVNATLLPDIYEVMQGKVAGQRFNLRPVNTANGIQYSLGTSN
jgi:esterase/lipase superfamily enzyme/predicted acylesterase/phospholipase RssA